MVINDNLLHAVLVALLKELPEERAQAIVNDWRQSTAAAEAEREAALPRLLDLRIDEVELSVRAERLLREHGIVTVRQLVEISPLEMRSWRGTGRRTVTEVRTMLQNHGLDLRAYD